MTFAAAPSGADNPHGGPPGQLKKQPSVAECDPIDTTQCLTPFPDDFFTTPDPSKPTGHRLNYPRDMMPANVMGVHVDPTDINRSDGFSPGSTIIVRVPGIDLAQTGAAPITDIARSLDPRRADRPARHRHRRTRSVLGGARHVEPRPVDPGARGPPGAQLRRGTPHRRGAAQHEGRRRQRHSRVAGVRQVPRPPAELRPRRRPAPAVHEARSSTSCSERACGARACTSRGTSPSAASRTSRAGCCTCATTRTRNSARACPP